MYQFALTEAGINISLILFFCYFTNSQPITIIPAKPKTRKREYLNKTILVILALYNIEK